ncbi:unnamed protein product [Protopolystoma xenopodis]|uniref:Uncharacterized protein n=1 Tax=Protopolystoma xenopodis TaxID=117903 RepID=A0A3S5AB12_9PLAT|nr:unnamed protein product [Protopolystoma xenopodis]
MRSLIKALITGVCTIVTKLIQWPRDFHAAATTLSGSTSSPLPRQPGLLGPTELALLIEYLQYGLRMIDITQIVAKDNQLYFRGT